MLTLSNSMVWFLAEATAIASSCAAVRVTFPVSVIFRLLLATKSQEELEAEVAKLPVATTIGIPAFLNALIASQYFSPTRPVPVKPDDTETTSTLCLIESSIAWNIVSSPANPDPASEYIL